MSTKKFFGEQTTPSRVKSEIVTEYFVAWACIMMQNHKKYETKMPYVGYIDLLCGPGTYKDGSKSTPIKILEKIIANPTFINSAFCHFNDRDKNIIAELKNNIDKIPEIEILSNKIAITCEEISENAIVGLGEKISFPILFFIDPWGYKVLSMQFVKNTIIKFGWDCIFFFNYNRINAAINNDKVKKRIEEIFGEKEFEQLKSSISQKNIPPKQREDIIINSYKKSLLKNTKANFFLLFRYKNKSERTTHFIVFITKKFRGYEVMKEIMAKKSSSIHDGVASFEYNEAEKDGGYINELRIPLIDDLMEDLLQKYRGIKKTMLKIFEEHSVGTPFISKNYKAALYRLHESGKITVDKKPRKRDTMSDDTMVTFTPRVL